MSERAASADHLAQGEDDVRGPLREPSHVPRIPRLAIRDEIADEIALAGQAALLVHPDAVQHLHFEAGPRETQGGGVLRGLFDEPDVMRPQPDPDMSTGLHGFET